MGIIGREVVMFLEWVKLRIFLEFAFTNWLRKKQHITHVFFRLYGSMDLQTWQMLLCAGVESWLGKQVAVQR